jgi:hypothetical protein
MIIEKLNEKFELDKRTYLPFILKINCKCCNKELKKNLTEDYLSYPIINSNQTIYFYCEDCDMEYQEEVQLIVKIEQV